MGSASLLVPCSSRLLSSPSIPPSISLSLSSTLWELASPWLWEVMNISSPFSSGSQASWQLPLQVGEKENREGLGWGWCRLKSLRKGEFTSARPGVRLDLGEDGQIQSLRPRDCLRLGSPQGKAAQAPGSLKEAVPLARSGAVPGTPGSAAAPRRVS